LSSRCILGFDFGTKYIGVAVGHRETRLAQPLACVYARDGRPDWTHLERLIKEWLPDRLVVGLPHNMDGSDTHATRAARRFGERLRARYNLPLEMVDERLSTRAARSALESSIDLAGSSISRDPSRHPGALNQLAAQVILQAWLDDMPKDKS
jgi:putative Holliday junction resolvase